MPGVRTKALAASLWLACYTGCSGGPSSPLIGSWEGSTTLFSGLTIQYQITFRSDHTMEIDDTVVYPNTRLSQPGCTEQDQAIGFVWATSTLDGSVPILTVDQSQAVQQSVFAGCTNPSDDQAIPAAPNPHVLDGSPFEYTLAGASLTLVPLGTGGGTLMLSRR